MDLQLHRTHYKTGTNGILFHQNQFLCFCIELPWRMNLPNTSCIPDGMYELETLCSPGFGHHLLLKDVPDRSGILLHPATDALKELKGGIAPVSQLTGIGKGLGSQKALNLLLMRIEGFRDPGEGVFLTICSEHSGK